MIFLPTDGSNKEDRRKEDDRFAAGCYDAGGRKMIMRGLNT
jgi:hypothetical protein